MAAAAKKKDGIWETVKTVVYALLIAGVFRTLFFQPFWIPSGSMKDTLLIGDFLFVNKMAYGYSRYSCPFAMCPFSGRIWGAEPERGDVIVFRHPTQNTDFIKRVVGLPGDSIQMRNGVLYVNGDEQVVGNLLDRGRGVGIADRVGGQAGEGSHRVGHRVHAGHGGDVRGPGGRDARGERRLSKRRGRGAHFAPKIASPENLSREERRVRMRGASASLETARPRHALRVLEGRVSGEPVARGASREDARERAHLSKRRGRTQRR